MLHSGAALTGTPAEAPGQRAAPGSATRPRSPPPSPSLWGSRPQAFFNKQRQRRHNLLYLRDSPPFFKFDSLRLLREIDALRSQDWGLSGGRLTVGAWSDPSAVRVQLAMGEKGNFSKDPSVAVHPAAQPTHTLCIPTICKPSTRNIFLNYLWQKSVL